MMQEFEKIVTALSLGALLLCAVPAMAARPKCGDGRCTGKENFQTCPEDCSNEEDIPVCATLGDSSGLAIISDGAGPYCNSLSNGIYAYFQHEAGDTSDLWVNLIDSERVFLVDFDGFLFDPDPDCIPSAWTEDGTTGWRLFVDEVDNVPEESETQEWDDFCDDPHQDCDSDDGGPYVRRRGTFYLNDNINKVTFELRFQMADWQDFDVNVPFETSYLKVYHPSINEWVIQPENDAVVTLLRNGKGRNNTTNCGQFDMPFEITVNPMP